MCEDLRKTTILNNAWNIEYKIRKQYYIYILDVYNNSMLDNLFIYDYLDSIQNISIPVSDKLLKYMKFNIHDDMEID